MDANTESSFVRNCIKIEYRDRLLFELQSKKHRQKAVSRFAHGCESILRDGYEKTPASEIFKLYDTASDNELCYVISDGANDGTTLPLQEAKALLQNAYMPLVLILPRFIVIKPEAEGGRLTCYVFAKGDSK